MTSTSPLILESKVICKQPGRYIGWPTIARTPAGELIAVFSGDRDAHVCPFGVTYLTRSSDNGHSWAEAQVIHNTPLDDRDAGICACSDGTLVVSWFTLYCDVDRYGHNQPPAVRARWRQHVEAIPEDEVRRWTGAVLDGDTRSRGHWIRRSPDGGHTWEEPQRVIPSSPHGPIELADGRLIYLGNDGYDRVAKSSSLIAAESHDKGRNWVTIARIDMWPGYPGEDPEGIAYLCEPHCVEVRPGHLLAMARYEEQPSREVRESDVLWQFESPDGGHTWTAPRPTKILGKPPHLTALDDGRILLSYGYRHPPYGERARLSRDGGRSWDETEVILRADAPNGDLGYPASVELDDGTVLTIYYQVDRPGEKTCLMTTRWMPGP